MDVETPAQTRANKLRDSFEKLRITIAYETKDFAALLGLTEREYDRAIRAETDFSSKSLIELSGNLEISLDHLSKGSVDCAGVAARLAGNQNYLPEIYCQNAHSRRRTSMNILGYIEEFYGWRLKQSVLRQLQVSESVFSQPDEKISLRFSRDAFDLLRKKGLNDREFYAMGAYSLINYSSSPVAGIIRDSGTITNAYEVLIGPGGICEKYFEQNNKYKLTSLSEASCTVECLSNTELEESVRMRDLGCSAICLGKAGVLAATPGYLGLPFANVQETTCVHRGDDACRFEVNFEFPSFSEKQRAKAS